MVNSELGAETARVPAVTSSNSPPSVFAAHALAKALKSIQFSCNKLHTRLHEAKPGASGAHPKGFSMESADSSSRHRTI